MKQCYNDYFCSFVEQFDRALTNLRITYSRGWIGQRSLINSHTICKHLESLEECME